MAWIEVYSGPFCPYCLRAKSLLRRKGVDFVEYDLHRDPDRKREMLERSGGRRTIPQIFINGRHIGGCDELYALERSGRLQQWLDEVVETCAEEGLTAAADPG